MSVLGRWSQARKAALVAAVALGVAGCSGLGGKGPAPAYDLLAAQSFPHRSGPPRGQLVIAEPAALAVLESEKIMVRPSPDGAAQMGDAQWQDRLPKLLQARIQQSFENANRLRAVGKPGDRLATDFVLLTDIRAFEVSVTDGTANVEIAAKLVGERSGRIIAARVFRASVPVDTTDGPNAVAALNDAFHKVVVDLVLWAARLV